MVFRAMWPSSTEWLINIEVSDQQIPADAGRSLDPTQVVSAGVPPDLTPKRAWNQDDDAKVVRWVTRRVVCV